MGVLLVAHSGTEGIFVTILKGVSGVEGSGFGEMVAELGEVVLEDCADRDDGCRLGRLA